MHPYPVSISLSSFGADHVRTQGQASLAPLVAQTGASHIELREELFDDFDAPSLRSAIAAQELTCVYSSPLELWQPGQAAPNPQLQLALARASACSAIWLKVSLGFHSTASDLHLLHDQLRDQPVRLLIENDQTAHGGRIEPLVDFFTAIARQGVPVGMTFDIGNWQWQQQSVSSAAQQLGRFVEYIHCKAVQRTTTGKLVATPPELTDLHQWARLLGHMAPGLVRAIEYPLQGSDLLAVAKAQVATLARLGQAAQEVAHG
ncbi:sugar phosphate isomerase/epimerase family protein [Pseudomonas baltica]|uniref:AP endonuclease n=1 Tax=Pseudomonas baltica TaxID=2762576 RepID=A0A7X1G435_9PSED|nr:AP endonuclease [Pseudomonas baltica]MBC2677364.1 AP endonuclease [Pseudomonas baltica]